MDNSLGLPNRDSGLLSARNNHSRVCLYACRPTPYFCRTLSSCYAQATTIPHRAPASKPGLSRRVNIYATAMLLPVLRNKFCLLFVAAFASGCSLFPVDSYVRFPIREPSKPGSVRPDLLTTIGLNSCTFPHHRPTLALVRKVKDRTFQETKGQKETKREELTVKCLCRGSRNGTGAAQRGAHHLDGRRHGSGARGSGDGDPGELDGTEAQRNGSTTE